MPDQFIYVSINTLVHEGLIKNTILDIEIHISSYKSCNRIQVYFLSLSKIKKNKKIIFEYLKKNAGNFLTGTCTVLFK